MERENKHISDELLTRWMCGKATPEEESAVLDYMSEDDEHLEDMLAMSAAIETTRTQDHKAKKVSPLWPALSAAASVILLIGIGVALWRNSQSVSSVGIDPAPSYAEQDTIDTVMSYEL